MTPYQQELIRLANDEWLAYYQYWAGAAQVKNEKLKAELLEHADEERKHSDWLTDILADYGLTPEKQFSNIIANTNCGYDMPVQISDGNILQSNLAAERCAIEAYSKVLMQTENPEHHKVLHKILMEEMKHEQDLLKLQKETQGMYLVKAIIRKSQMSFDFGGNHDHHVAYTRTNASGTVSHIQAKGVQPDMHTMVQTARRWKGAAMNADEDHGTDNRARLKHSRMTTKADLDNYLMRKFGVDEVTARNVSNHLTEKDIPADRTAEPSEFAGEPWADAVLAKQITSTQKREEAAAAKDFEVFAVRQANARRNFDEALQTIAGITPEQAQRVTQYYLDKKLAVMDSVNGTIRPKHGAYLDKDVVLNAVKLSGQPDTKKVGATKDPLKIQQQDDERKRDQAEAHTERVKRLLDRYHSEPDREYAEDMYGESLRKYGAHPEQKPQYTPEATEQKPYLPVFEKPVRKPRGNPNKPAAPEHRIAKVDDPDGGHGHFVIYDRDMKPVEIPNEHGEIEAAWPRLLDATRALNRHTGGTHTQQKVARGEYDMHKSIAHPVSLIKSRKLHGRLDYQGIPISIETGKSRIREWHDPHNNTQGMTRMDSHYGYITNGPDGTDGDKLDVYVGPDMQAANVYIVNQMKAPDFQSFDEQKIMLGYTDEATARKAYLRHYDNPQFLGSMDTMPFAEFKQKIESGSYHGKMIKSHSEQKLAAFKQAVVQEGGPEWDAYSPKEILQGMDDEQEHADVTNGDLLKTAKIVLAHLKEHRNYYTKLKAAGLE